MKKMNPDKVKSEFRDGIESDGPIIGRKYTMTHSDDTADLFVTIGRNYAEDKIGPLRDEVLLEFEMTEDELQLTGTVLIDGEGLENDSERRNRIFLQEMPLALQAIRYADRKLFEQWPQLDYVPVYIWFRSGEEQYNQLYDYKKMKDYR